MYNCQRNWVIFLCADIVFSATPQLVLAVTIDMVAVGNPGNAPDLRYNDIAVGSVNYVYQIGKYEVTAGQYTEFLNAVAKEDPNGLYNAYMDYSRAFGACNILRSGVSPNFSYSVAADWADRPVNYVSFWDAARFANWLHNGQPTGPQGLSTTESGAYVNIGNQATFSRQVGARYFIPTEDEWYKAAYHNKASGLAGSYFDYPTGMNSAPTRDTTEVINPGNNGNFYDFSESYLLNAPYYRTPVGEFELSDSPYGTFDQGGNVWEWNEVINGSSRRDYRGGEFGTPRPTTHMHPGAVATATVLRSRWRPSASVSQASSEHRFLATTTKTEPSIAPTTSFGGTDSALATLQRNTTCGGTTLGK